MTHAEAPHHAGNAEIAELDIAGLDIEGLDIDGLDNGVQCPTPFFYSSVKVQSCNLSQPTMLSVESETFSYFAVTVLLSLIHI